MSYYNFDLFNVSSVIGWWIVFLTHLLLWLVLDFIFKEMAKMMSVCKLFSQREWDILKIPKLLYPVRATPERILNIWLPMVELLHSISTANHILTTVEEFTYWARCKTVQTVPCETNINLSGFFGSWIWITLLTRLLHVG